MRASIIWQQLALETLAGTTDNHRIADPVSLMAMPETCVHFALYNIAEKEP
ncbi:MAG: hypothetical protein R3C05_17645 [Pirellulaceae bacterium]